MQYEKNTSYDLTEYKEFQCGCFGRGRFKRASVCIVYNALFAHYCHSVSYHWSVPDTGYDIKYVRTVRDMGYE